MADFDTYSVNTNGLDNSITKLASAINDFETNVNNYYKEIEVLEKYWKGVDAEKYFHSVYDTKAAFDGYLLIFDQYYKNLKDYASKIESIKGIGD